MHKQIDNSKNKKAVFVLFQILYILAKKKKKKKTENVTFIVIRF